MITVKAYAYIGAIAYSFAINYQLHFSSFFYGYQSGTIWLQKVTV